MNLGILKMSYTQTQNSLRDVMIYYKYEGNVAEMWCLANLGFRISRFIKCMFSMQLMFLHSICDFSVLAVDCAVDISVEIEIYPLTSNSML